jgi:hypothetical protein
MAKKCMQCGGKVKMAKGGSTPKPFAAGIPYAAGAGQTDGKNGKMQRGGKIKAVPSKTAFERSVDNMGGPDKPPMSSPVKMGSDGAYRKKPIVDQPAPKRKYAKGGSSFGMNSVKTGFDNNPKATAADRIAAAKMQKGGKVKSVAPPKTQTVVIKPKSSDAYEIAKKAQAMKSSGLAMKHKGQMMKAEGQALKAKGQAMKATGSIKPKTGMDGVNALAYRVKKGGVYKAGGTIKKAKKK